MALGLQLGLAGGGGAATLYGMWWDENLAGNHVTLPIDGESGMIFEATMQNTASKVIGALSDANGGTYFGYFLDGGSGVTGAHAGTPAYYVDGVLVASDQDDLHDALSDGFPHALRVTGLNLSHADWTQMILGGYSASFIPEGTFRDVVLRQSDETIVGRWNGYGNTNADWEDQVGSNDGTVSGSPSRAVSTDGGATWAMETASDADAAAYVTRLLNTGTSITPAQISALDTFFLTGKSEGWYSALKRMYLPIWAAAGPNTICMVSGTSGTFTGGVTHAAGYVTGNGSTSDFSVGATPSALGISTGDAFIMRGIHINSPTTSYSTCGVGASSAASSLILLNYSSTTGTTYFRQPSSAAQVTLTGQGSEYRGIYIGSSTATNARFLLRRRSGGTTVATSTASDTQSIFDQAPRFLARNLNGIVQTRTDGSEFAWAVGTGMTEAQAGDFTAALETMWETCTGLTLF